MECLSALNITSHQKSSFWAEIKGAQEPLSAIEVFIHKLGEEF
jgi:hypothetical protein